MPKLLLFDTFYFLHRSFHAYPKDLKNSKGQHTNIVFGLAQSFLDTVSELAPTHIACGWESEELPSFRKKLYPKYQITRIPMEADEEKIFSEQIPSVIELLKSFNIPRITQNGFEGDDILGTVATLASDFGADVVIATSDQDILQLINKKILVFRPARPPYVKKILFNEEIFKEKYGFTPKQMIDYKALRGDPSDNIPGVKGVGEKTAKDLIGKFGDIDEIYKNIENVESVSIRQKLIDQKDMAYLSRQLATIITNIPMDFNLDDCEVHDFNEKAVRSLFERLEFRSLNKKLDSLLKVKTIKDKLKSSESQPALF